MPTRDSKGRHERAPDLAPDVAPDPVADRHRAPHAAATNYLDFLRRSLIVVAAALVPVLIWYLSGVVLMVFGAVILAALLRLGAAPLKHWLSLPEGLALVVSGAVVLVVVGTAAYLFGTRITGELQDVIDRVGSASTTITATLQGSAFGRFVLDQMKGARFSVTDLLSGLLRVGSNFVEALVIVAISGVYLAAQPRVYRDGFIQLFPPRAHRRAAIFIDGLGEALRLWLLGQLAEMVLIGVLSTFAVWIIGVPAPLGLGIIAAVGEFIPYLGPILAAIPAVLVAITKSPQTALWTLIAYLIIHQIEGQVVAPLIQRHMVFIPPAVMLLGIVAITYLFGAIAIVFAAPMAVVIFAAVNLIYMRDTLGERTALTRKLR